MSSFAFVFLCIQACLVQNVFSQCLGAYGPAIAPAALSPAAPCGYGAGLGGLAYPGVGFSGAGLAGLAYPSAGFGGLAYPGAGLAGLDYPGADFGRLAYPAAGFAGAYPGAGLAPYGGAGEGNVAVAGELPVAGTTAVAGQVPIMGSVSFSGPVAAAGTVSIIGQCACGCGASNRYLY